MLAGLATEASAQPTVTISGGAAVTEGTGAQFTVNASAAPAANLTVDLTVADAGGSDFVAGDDEGAKTVTVLAGQTSATYTVPTVGDQVDEPDGSVTVTLVSRAGYNIGTPSSATVRVTDDDTGFCDRTPQVRAAILGKISGIGSCGDVTASHLAAVTGTLNLSLKNISSLKPGDFDGLTALTGLNLYFNRLAALPAGVFDELTALTDLDLSTNRLTALPASVFGGLTALTDLDLYGNRLTALPTGVFGGLTALEDLSMGDNRLTALPAGVFDGLTALESLVVSDNRLTALPAGVFGGLTALESLSMSGNRLTALPAGVFDGLTALENLFMRVNRLTTLPESIFAKLTALDRLTLDQNPGAPFAPAVDAGSDRSVASGAAVSLSGAATGLWGDRVDWRWVQVDGAESGTAVTDGVTLAGATEATVSFTAPSREAFLHFRLTATPQINPNSRGVAGGADWVTVPVDRPTVTISADATLVTEGADVVFTLTATPAPDAALSVPVAVSEKAAGRSGRDFVAWAWEKTHTVSIPASGTATLTIPTVRDGLDEPEGLVTAALRPGGYGVGDPSSASVTIADDNGPPPPTAELSIDGATPLPEGAAVLFNIWLSRALDADETVTLPLAVGGTAARGTDYRLSCAASSPPGVATCNDIDGAGPSITFHGARLDGVYRISYLVRLEAIEDGTAESPETVTLSLGGGRTETLRLKDAPSSVVLSFVQGTFSSITESGLIQPTLRVDSAPGRDIPFTLVFTDMTATAGADYVKKTTATFPANGRTVNFFDIQLPDDALCEGDETFRVAIDASSLPSGVTLGAHGSTVLTIEDDDCTVTVAGVSDAKEGEQAAFAVHVDPAPVRDMAIGYAVSEDAGNGRAFVASGDKGGGRTVTVPAGRASADVSVLTLQAAGTDADGHVTVTLESGDQYTLGNPSSASVRVFDEGYEADHVTFTGVAGSAKGPLHAGSEFGTWTLNEDVGAIWVELGLSQTPKSQTTVYVRERGSGTTATRGVDYERPPSGWTANFGTGRKGRARFKIPIVADGIDDDRETLTLDIYEVSNVHGDFRPDNTPGHGANTGPLGTYGLTIRDYTSNASGDDVGVWLSGDAYEVAEGEALEGTVHLQEPRGVDTVISVTETRGTARSGTDYTAGPYPVTVPAGGTTGTFTIQTAEDTELEMNEAFRVRIDDASLPAGFVTPNGTGTPEEARVTINDDEYTFCFLQRSYSIREGEELAADIGFSRPLPQGGWFKFTYSDRNASDGADYTRVNAFPDVFWLPAGTERYTLRVPIVADTLYEGNELFHVVAGVPALPDGHNACSVDIIIRDVSPEVDFVAAAYTAHEGRAAEVAVRVVERGTDDPMKLRKPVTLHVADSGTGTATSGTDYAAGPWTLTIPAGASRGVLRIPVHADAVSDDGETIDLAIRRAGTGTSHNDRRLLGADGAVSPDNLHVRARDVTDMANGAATVTIRNASEAPWGAPVVWIEAGPQVSEGNDATFTLKASPPPLAPLDVSVHVGETDVSHDLTDPFSGIRRHLAEGDRGLKTATVDTTGSTVFTVPTRTNGAANTGTVRVALMDPSLVFGDGEADYTVGRPDAAYVGVDTAAPEFEAQRSAGAVAPTEPVRNLRATAIDTASAEVSWDAVPHATAYRLEWEGGSGGDYIGGGSNGVTGTTRTIYHNAPAAMTLTIRVIPWHVADDGEVRVHDALAATATLDVGPEDPLTAARAACNTASLKSDIEGYIGEQADGTPHVTRWKKVLAAFGTDNGYTKMNAAEAQTYADRGWSRWDPVVEALECIEQAEASHAAASLPEIAIAGGGAVTEGTPASFIVTTDPAPAAPLAVTLTVSQSGDFAAAGQTGSRQVTVPTDGSVTVQVATVDDAVPETDGSVSATVSAGTGYAAAAPGDAASVAVADNDTPVVRVAAGNDVTEGSPASFTLTANPTPQADLTVTLAVSQSGDFAASGATGTREVTVPTGGSATFEVATVNDTADEPDGSVTATVSAGTGYAVAPSPNDTASVAVADDDAAPAVPELAIGDVTANEADRFMWFTVSLSPASDRAVSVDYETRESRPVSARRNGDFLAMDFGRLTFRPGETSKRFWVYLLDDSHDEDPETFEVVLSDPTGGAKIADGVAVATIVNSDPMPQAWLGRMGRTLAQQALDGITGRLTAPRTPGAQGTLAGQAFTLRPGGPTESASDPTTPAPSTLERLAALVLPGLAAGGAGGMGADPAFGGADPLFGGGLGDGDAGAPGFRGGGLAPQTFTLRDALLGSSFTATGQPDAWGGSVALWGRAALATFDGQEDTFALDGEVLTGLLGVDYARDRWLLGVSLLQSASTGGYLDRNTGATPCPAHDLSAEMRQLVCDGAVRAGDGKVEATLTAAVPYAAFQASERLHLWGAAGYGAGEVTLTPETGDTLTTDLDWTMAQMGVRGTVLAPATDDAGLAGGPALAVTSDALWARTTSEKIQDGLAASESDVTRLRLGLEGSWLMALEDLGQMTPKLAVGARHDGGDAETGFGVELGGGLAWAMPTAGLALNVEGRTLLTHREEAFQDQGLAASFVFDPDPATPRGPSLTLRQDWGGAATGGVEALFASNPLAQRQSTTATRRWAADMAWGFPAWDGAFTSSPLVGLGLAPGSRDYRLGWRLVPATAASAFALEVQALRREPDAAIPEHRVGLELSTRW